MTAHAQRLGRTSIALAAVAAALLGLIAVMGAVHGRPLEAVSDLAVGAVYLVLGLRIAEALPGHAVGRRMLLAAAVVAFALFCDLWRHWSDWGVLFDDGTFVLVLGALVGIVVVFPDGRAASPRWARADHGFGALVVAYYLIGIAGGAVLRRGGDVIPSPLTRHSGVLEVASLALLVVLFGWLVAVTVGARARYRRARGIERLQLSWLAYVSATIPLAIVLCVVDRVALDGQGVLTGLAFGVALLALPAGVTVAILRHRLYDIDRLINRTLVYAAVTAALAAAYAGVALGVGVAAGRSGSWAVAAATLAVAVLFRPVRDRLQRAVDRRFARRRYEGLRRVETFLDAVRAGREDPERIDAALAEALGDDGLEVWFRLPASGGYADALGRLGEPPDDPLRRRSVVRQGDLELGLVLHDPHLEDRPDALASVLRAAVLPMELARLRVEVRVQLAEVEASRARLVAAAEAERRKLERDIHDGAQQRLVALGLALRHAQHQLGGDPDGALRTLDEAVGEIAAAVAELREIARGLRPGLLDAGLGPALAGVAERSPVPVALEVSPGRLTPEVEAAAFYLACEAVTNAVKHAGARHVRLRVDTAGGGLRLEVADDGAGGARIVPGGGLAGMAERAAARGGVLHVESPVGAGTRIVVELPVGS